VTGTLEGGFVEFEFSIGDPDLAVELVMLFPQFEKFSKQHDAVHLTTEQGAQLDYERMKWRYGAPGIDR
jgi:phenol hydroxylase P0 protein